MLQYEEVADKDDLMGVEDTAKKDILFSLTLWESFSESFSAFVFLCFSLTPSCTIFLQTVPEESEYHLHCGPAGGHTEPR